MPVPLHELLIAVRVRVVPHLADLVPPEPDHDAGALVQHVGGVALEPALLADLDDHALLGVVPAALDVLVAPVGGAEAGFSVREPAQHPVAPLPGAADRRPARDPVGDVVGEVAADLVHATGEQRLLVRPGDVHALAHTIASSGFALRPARSIGRSIMARFWSRIFQKSTARSTSSRDASRSASLAFTCRTLFCMSSASQPRECAMNGNGGKTKPSSDQKVSMPPATA